MKYLYIKHIFKNFRCGQFGMITFMIKYKKVYVTIQKIFDSIPPKSKVHIIYPYQNEIAYIDRNCNVAMFSCMIKMILPDARKIKNDIQP